MKKSSIWLIAIMLSVTLTGCLSLGGGNGPPVSPEVMALTEGAGIASLAFFGDASKEAYPDPKVRGLKALEKANEYLLLFYGTLDGSPRFTIAGLIHDDEILGGLVDERYLKIAYVARLVLNKDGTLTGMSWADALIFGEVQAVTGAVHVLPAN